MVSPADTLNEPSAVRSIRRPTQAREVRHLIGCLVKIVWVRRNDLHHEWPFFRVLRARDGRVRLRGADYSDDYAIPYGDEFWADMRGIVTIGAAECMFTRQAGRGVNALDMRMRNNAESRR